MIRLTGKYAAFFVATTSARILILAAMIGQANLDSASNEVSANPSGFAQSDTSVSENAFDSFFLDMPADCSELVKLELVGDYAFDLRPETVQIPRTIDLPSLNARITFTDENQVEVVSNVALTFPTLDF
ncbi:MAG: hypothetical protein SGI77_21790 [Pirellulaceae bacterium]|nr:hypothetical protein [Pirellulaceae bacterium]